MRRTLLQAVRQLYVFRCGYCGISEEDTGAALTVDHYQPRAHGGEDTTDNLVYCCHACNEFKSDLWDAEAAARVLHPLRDDVTAHVAEQEDGTVIARTERGALHIRVLHLNRPPLVARRRVLRQRAAETLLRQEMLRSLQSIEERLSRLEDEFRQFPPVREE